MEGTKQHDLRDDIYTPGADATEKRSRVPTTETADFVGVPATEDDGGLPLVTRRRDKGIASGQTTKE